MSENDLVVEALLEFLNAVEAGVAGAKQIIGARKGISIAVSEEIFNVLKFEAQKGAKIGDYEVAYEPQNLSDGWSQAYKILRQANATIQSRYHGDGYHHVYWLYGKAKIYRQRLKST